MTYVRNTWYVAAWSHEIAVDQPLATRVLNEPIVMWRDSTGRLAALADRCLHRLAPLSLGRCQGETLRCRYHGWLYDHAGRLIEIPGQAQMPASGLQVRVYPVVERYGWVWVWIGEPARANAELIPPLVGIGHPDYEFDYGQLDYAAEARLITDNLLDLSHVSFLHTESFRMSEIWARARPKLTEQERGIRSERWVRNEGPMGELNATNRVDTYFRCDFFIPGVLLMSARAYPVGTAAALSDAQPPQFSSMEEGFTTQAVTPMTDRTARYFYMMGWPRGRVDQASRDATRVIYEKGFAEDQRMIEAQQRSIDASPAARFMSSSADQGVVLFNRLVEKLARQELAQ